jgi:hypothetical protein
MHNLKLEFSSGLIEGEGRDIIGRFTFHGTYDNVGAVRLVKQYIGRHQVAYVGTYDGEGTIHGRWFIGEKWSGTFALSPVRDAIAPNSPIEPL